MIGKHLVVDGQIIDSDSLDQALLQNGKAVYEVIRIVNGVPLFIEDHLKRLENSLEMVFGNCRVNQSEIINIILKLAAKNEIYEGNIKLIVQQESGSQFKYHLFFIPHHYPTVDEYRRGYLMKSLIMERPNPGAKVINQSLTETVSKMKTEDANLDEVLLVRHDGIVAEGSRSNIFFVDGNQLITASEKLVLAGITRAKIIELCSENQIKCAEKSDLLFSDVSKMDGAFITGTSPKVMAVRQIDSLAFDIENKLIQKIAGIYDKMIVDYINGFNYSV
jgi:branched-chain amino acid aminotransferase